MSNFMAVNGESDDAFYIEVIPVDGSSGIKKTSKGDALEKLTTERFSDALRKAVLPACNTFVSLWQDVKQSDSLVADSAEVEFNLGLTASGNMAIVQTSGQASFKIKVTWKFKPTTIDVKAICEKVNQDIDLLQKEADELEKLIGNVESFEQDDHKAVVAAVREIQKLRSL